MSAPDESSTEIARRTEAAVWTKGGPSPNPGGRPKAIAEVVELAREHTTNAIEKLVEIINNPKANAQARVKAIEVLLDRGYGRPAQALDVTGMGSQVLSFTLVAGKAPEEIEE